MSRKREQSDSRRVVVISATPPKVSEAWMTRMTDYFLPNVLHIALFSGHEPNPTSARLETLSAPLPNLPLRMSLIFKRQELLKKLRAALAINSENGTPQILCHYLSNAVYLWPVLSKYSDNLFIHAHGHDVTWNRKFERLPFLPAHPRGYKTKARKVAQVSKIIANSKATEEKLHEIGIQAKNIHLKYLGVPDFRSIEEYSSISIDRSKIVYLGRMVDFKGPIETLEAFERVCKTGIVANLHFIGDGDLKTKLEQKVARSPFRDRITIHGSLPNKEALKHVASANFLTAHNKRSSITGQEEAFGVAPIEAMILGVPVITGASGGIKETIVNGETGLLFEPNDITAHAAAMIQILKNPQRRNKLAKNARSHCLQKFSLATEEKRLKNIIFQSLY